MPDEHGSDDRPPYLSLTTLLNFLDRWGDGPIPPRIDKSALDTYSGATQSQLLSALKLMGYVDHEGLVLPPLRQAVDDEPARKAYLAQWARQFYNRQLELADQNATSQMLQESFAQYGYTGSTLRKAIVFYLSLVEYLGLPNSPHFRPPKQGATPTSRRRTRTLLPSQPQVAPPPPVHHTPSGEVSVISIGDLATITITVDAQWMKLPVATITSMREAIDKLEALGTEAPS